MAYLYDTFRLLGSRPLRALWDLDISGAHHVPRRTGAIVAANHLSVCDEYFLMSAVPRRMTFWAKEDYFTGTGASGAGMRLLMRGLGAIPVQRAGGREALAALAAALPVLRGGGLVCVYPEGTRSPDGRLYRGRTGVAHLAMAAGVPVVPVGITGTDRVQPIGRRLPAWERGAVSIRFGAPLPPPPAPEGSPLRTAREFTAAVMDAVQELSGLPYVGTFAPPRARTAA